MPAFNFIAFDSLGKKKDGFINAASEREARRLIKNLNLTPIEVFKTSKTFSKKIKIKSKTIYIDNRQLATLLD